MDKINFKITKINECYCINIYENYQKKFTDLKKATAYASYLQEFYLKINYSLNEAYISCYTHFVRLRPIITHSTPLTEFNNLNSEFREFEDSLFKMQIQVVDFSNVAEILIEKANMILLYIFKILKFEKSKSNTVVNYQFGSLNDQVEAVKRQIKNIIIEL